MNAFTLFNPDTRGDEEKTIWNDPTFLAMIENGHDGISLLGMDGKLKYVTPSVQRIMGYTVEELIGTDPALYTHPHDRDRIVALIMELAERFGETRQAVYRMHHKNGNWKWIRSNIRNMLHMPEIQAFVFNYEDITDRINSEIQHDFDNRNLDALINSTSDLMWSIDKNLSLITANQAFIQSMKMVTDQDIAPGDKILFDSDRPAFNPQVWSERYRRALAGETFTLEDHYDYPIEVWAEVSFNPIVESDQIVGAACFARDVTQRKKIEAALGKSEANMRTIFEHTDVGYTLLDKDKNVVAFNPIANKWVQQIYKAPLIQGRRFFEYFRPEEEPATRAVFDRVLNGENLNREIQRIMPDGKECWFLVRITCIKGAEGNIYGYCIATSDITERKLAEQEKEKMTLDLIQRNKDLEQFAYIVSHNLRAPVANIIGFTRELMDETYPNEIWKSFLEELSASAHKLENVIRDLNGILEMKRVMQENREDIDLEGIVNDITKSLSKTIHKEQAVIRADFSRAPRIFSLKSYIHSILYNLISNSIKYHRPGVPPVIDIESRQEGEKLIITLTDNGLGIDLASKGEQVFGLYKRFHSHIEGKGLGLFMSKTQVETLGGKISIQSAVNEGTTFIIEFKQTL